MDDDEYFPPKRPPGLGRAKARSWHAVLILGFISAAAFGVWYWFTDHRDERTQLKDDIRARIIDGRDIGFALPAFDVRSTGDAEDLANDPDPNVRAAAVEFSSVGSNKPQLPRETGTSQLTATMSKRSQAARTQQADQGRKHRCPTRGHPRRGLGHRSRILQYGVDRNSPVRN